MPVMLLAAALLAGCQTTGETRRIETRPGGAAELHVFRAGKPAAVLLLFEGGPGVFDPGGNGFVNAHYADFVAQGFTVAVLGAPADQHGLRGGPGMHPRFRETAAHRRDIDAAVAALRRDFPLPLWLVGISMGTKSVANYASTHAARIDGAVFLSSSTRPPRGSRPVTDYNLAAIRAPVLAIAHRNDGCSGTPPAGAEEIAAAARNSVAAKALLMDGGAEYGRSPCLPGTHHTFAGIEDRVVAAVADFIRRHTARGAAAR